MSTNNDLNKKKFMKTLIGYRYIILYIYYIITNQGWSFDCLLGSATTFDQEKYCTVFMIQYTMFIIINFYSMKFFGNVIFIAF